MLQYLALKMAAKTGEAVSASRTALETKGRSRMLHIKFMVSFNDILQIRGLGSVELQPGSVPANHIDWSCDLQVLPRYGIE
jgi:hypothetical protein